MNISLETKIFIGIAVGTLLLIGLAAFLLGKNTSSVPVVVDQSILINTNSHSIGSADAKVTVVEFSDFQCPACKAAEPVVQKILDEYKDKIRFVYRNYPLPSHQYGMVAAQAAEAAGLQNKFWEMHKLLFEKSPDLSRELLFEYAKSLNLDMDKFTKDFDSGAVKEAISKDQNDGNLVGLDATPTFYINGVKFTGVLSLSKFETEINSRLK